LLKTDKFQKKISMGGGGQLVDMDVTVMDEEVDWVAKDVVADAIMIWG
jgi:hypothetical protein